MRYLVHFCTNCKGQGCNPEVEKNAYPRIGLEIKKGNAIFQSDISLIFIPMVQKHRLHNCFDPQHIDCCLYQNKLPRFHG